MASAWQLDPDRLFDPDPTQRAVARELYRSVADRPLICPHGHVEPRLFADDDAAFGTPSEVFIIPDHYVFRLLTSQGISLDSLGIATLETGKVEQDHRRIWQLFAENFHLFRGTPTGLWLKQELIEVFGIGEKLTGETAQAIYDEIEWKLSLPEFQPRSLFERFNIEVLSTTDAATDGLENHQRIQTSDWEGDVRPTFRPDAVVDILSHRWRDSINALSDASGVAVHSYDAYIEALEDRRRFFKSMGATATDHAALSAYTAQLRSREAEEIFQRALRGEATEEDARHFTAHMVMAFARMAVEDGLVMQFHVGAVRGHNRPLSRRFGADIGADIPRRTEFTQNLRPLLNRYGNDPHLTFIIFTLDEAAYSRELAPLAGHYPALKLGPPWWFHDSPNGIQRYLDRVTETAGLCNTVGFNDDTRAFPSIPARHDVWRRVGANWVADLVVRGIVDEEDAREMMLDMAYRLAKQVYKFDAS